MNPKHREAVQRLQSSRCEMHLPETALNKTSAKSLAESILQLQSPDRISVSKKSVNALSQLLRQQPFAIAYDQGTLVGCAMVHDLMPTVFPGSPRFRWISMLATNPDYPRSAVNILLINQVAQAFPLDFVVVTSPEETTNDVLGYYGFKPLAAMEERRWNDYERLAAHPLWTFHGYDKPFWLANVRIRTPRDSELTEVAEGTTGDEGGGCVDVVPSPNTS